MVITDFSQSRSARHIIKFRIFISTHCFLSKLSPVVGGTLPILRFPWYYFTVFFQDLWSTPTLQWNEIRSCPVVFRILHMRWWFIAVAFIFKIIIHQQQPHWPAHRGEWNEISAPVPTTPTLRASRYPPPEHIYIFFNFIIITISRTVYLWYWPTFNLCAKQYSDKMYVPLRLRRRWSKLITNARRRCIEISFNRLPDKSVVDDDATDIILYYIIITVVHVGDGLVIFARVPRVTFRAVDIGNCALGNRCSVRDVPESRSERKRFSIDHGRGVEGIW